MENEKHEFWAFIHTLANGILTVTPNDRITAKKHIPINLVSDITMDETRARYALISVPLFVARGFGLTRSAPIVESNERAETSNNRINEGGGQLALAKASVESGNSSIGMRAVESSKAATPPTPPSQFPAELEAHVERAVTSKLSTLFANLNIVKPTSLQLQEAADDLGTVKPE